MNELVADGFLAEKTAAITSLVGLVQRDIAEIGRHLSEVKEHFGRGDNPKFLAWASEAFGWSRTTVYRYIEIFEFMRSGDFLNLRKLDLDVSSLYLLISPEPQYMLVRPDAAPPTAHVDAAPGDVMVEHLRAELAASQEEIEQLKSYIDDFKVNAKHNRNEIVELRAARAALEDRVHRMETARADEFAAFLLHYCWGGDTQTLMERAQEFIPEVFEALERGLAARQQTAPKEEPAPPTQPAEPGAQTWEKIVDIYLASTRPCRRITQNSSPQWCIGRTITASMSRNLSAVAARKRLGTPRPRIAASRAPAEIPTKNSAPKSCESLDPENATASPR